MEPILLDSENPGVEEKGGKIIAASNSSVTNSLDKHPQGKVRAWLTVLGAALVQVTMIGIVSSYGVFQEFYTTTWLTRSSTSSISWIGSIQLFLNYCISPITGELLDRGYFRAINIAGTIIFVLSLLGSSFAQPEHYYQLFLSQGIGLGLGSGLVFLPTTVVAIRHFRTGQAFAIGVVDSSISLGGLIFSIVLNYMMHGSLGFGWGVRVTALITIVCCVLGIFLMSMPPLEHSGSSVSILRKPARWIDVMRDAWRDWPYLLALLQGFVMSLGSFVPQFYVQLFAETHGVDKQISFFSLSLFNVLGAVGRVLFNYLADQFGVLDVYVPCVAITGGLCFAMLGATNTAGLFLFSAFYGLFFGGTNGMYMPLINSLSKGRNEDYLWKRCALSLLPPSIAVLIGPPIAGAILGPHNKWLSGILFASVTLLVSTGLVVLSKTLVTAEKKRKMNSPQLGGITNAQ